MSIYKEYDLVVLGSGRGRFLAWSLASQGKRASLGAAAASEVEDLELMARPEGSCPVTPTRACPRCGAGRLVAIAELPAMAPVRRGAGPADRDASLDTL